MRKTMLPRVLPIITLLSLAPLGLGGCADDAPPGDDDIGDTESSTDEDSESSTSSESDSTSSESDSTSSESDSTSSGEDSTSSESDSTSSEEDSSSSEEDSSSSSEEDSSSSSEEDSSSSSEEDSTSSESSSSEEADSTSSEEDSSSSESSESSDTFTEEDTFDSFDTFFIPFDDAAPLGECDPFAQDCPEGEKCSPFASGGDSWDANKCVLIQGNGAPGDPCVLDSIVDGNDDCDGSSYCFNGFCTAFCSGTIDEPLCDTESSCLIANQGSITLCIPECDPLLQDCEPGLGCYFAGETFSCLPQTENVPPGEPCAFINDCTPGNICVDGTMVPNCLGDACCSSLCELGLADQCAANPGTSCQPFGEGFDPIGICLTP